MTQLHDLPAYDSVIEDDHLRTRLLAIAKLDAPPVPRWLLATIAVFQSLEPDDPYEQKIADLIDQAENDLGIDGEELFDLVSEFAE